MKSFIYVLIILLTLGACSSQTTSSKSSEPLVVDFSMTPEHAEANKPVRLNLKVQRGKETLQTDQLDDVSFEIWNAKNKNRRTYKAKQDHRGYFYTEQNFKSDTTYFVKYKAEAGKQVYEETKRLTFKKDEEANQHSSEEHGAHSHPEDGLSVHLMKDYNEEEKELSLMAHLTKNSEALTKAKVHFEIWSANNNKHLESIESEETQKGEYTGEGKTDLKAGTYTVNIHVEYKGETALLEEKINLP